ncbi:hemerythrin domain-containing protein [Inmirania thermothiophila]|uniref:Hemerythrin-like domain-containing protein n=1 Tax=Inmirania thermothiophila TaxID=1750597 RepID=A0A3N1XSA0_9GAMM|nr:hemerythrin domain-containing protein [Inmirania thermothiophila]ROR29529.1 hemerythrin-like domain-containing protein [Inmirania thermothiophila]
MSEISSFMTRDHRDCDELFAAAENAVHEGDWEAARERFAAFADALRRHLDMEEQVLFPEIEERTGMVGGPTQVMRIEHQQMRDVIAAMEQAVADEDADEYLGQAETLMILMQQHNMKEEQILYPMSDQALGGDAAEVLGRMRAL